MSVKNAVRPASLIASPLGASFITFPAVEGFEVKEGKNLVLKIPTAVRMWRFEIDSLPYGVKVNSNVCEDKGN